MRLLLALLCASAPVTAAASCISGTRCLCEAWDGAALATIRTVAGPETTLDIDEIHGNTGALAAGSAVRLPRAEGDAPQRRSLLHFSGGNLAFWQLLEPDGTFSCRFSAAPLRMPASEAAALSIVPDCPEQLVARGFQSLPCDDVGGCASEPAAAAGLLGALVVRRRRGARRRRPRC